MLVLCADGKGIVTRPEALRPGIAAKTAAASTKLDTRLSKGEKRNRKRLAEVGAVYDLSPVPRSAADVMAPDTNCEPVPAPKAKSKWVTATLADAAAEVLGRIFNEAEGRDPDHKRTWVALVDGNNHQIERLHAEAQARGVKLNILVDLTHVLEYLWAAAWCFFTKPDRAAETWVQDRTLGDVRLVGQCRPRSTSGGRSGRHARR